MAQFLNDPGTNGLIQAQFNLMTTELNALGSGAAATSSVNGTNSDGKFTQTNWSNAVWGGIELKSGGAFTPAAGGFIAGWFLLSQDGGANFEALISSASTTVAPLGRNPDFILPTYEGGAAWASGNIRAIQGRFVKVPWESHKIVVWNQSGAALPATGNIIRATGMAIKVV